RRRPLGLLIHAGRPLVILARHPPVHGGPPLRAHLSLLGPVIRRRIPRSDYKLWTAQVSSPAPALWRPGLSRRPGCFFAASWCPPRSGPGGSYQRSPDLIRGRVDADHLLPLPLPGLGELAGIVLEIGVQPHEQRVLGRQHLQLVRAD